MCGEWRFKRRVTLTVEISSHLRGELGFARGFTEISDALRRRLSVIIGADKRAVKKCPEEHDLREKPSEPLGISEGIHDVVFRLWGADL
jgi:hypothetical protein